MADFEQTWSDDWLPRGQQVRFDRLTLTRDDLASMVETMSKATGGAAFLSAEAALIYLGLAAGLRGHDRHHSAGFRRHNDRSRLA